MYGHRSDHAIVLGASLAGLAAAAALARRFPRVTVLERRACPSGSASIAPQGVMPHVLLPGGAQALERLLPGLRADLDTAGGGHATVENGRWWSEGWRVPYPGDTSYAPLASRGLVEASVRARVDALPAVRFEHGVAAAGLRVRDGRVIGVVTDGGRDLVADLVVDASGRGSRLPAWLEAAGHAAPPVSEVKVDLGYVGAELEGDLDRDLGGTRWAVIQNVPPATRMGVVLGVEGGRWLVLLGGYFGDRPPADPDGYRAFAAALPDPLIADLLARRRPTAFHPYRFAASRRVHFERARLPAGLLVVGDAMTSVNPIYGQGMSVAALQAEALGALLDRGDDPASLTRVGIRRLAAIADQAWQVSVGADFAYPATEGARPPAVAMINRHVARVMRACTIDPVVCAAMSDVQYMLSPPSRLMQPGIVLRTLRAQGRWRRAQTRASTAASGSLPAAPRTAALAHASDHVPGAEATSRSSAARSSSSQAWR